MGPLWAFWNLILSHKRETRTSEHSFRKQDRWSCSMTAVTELSLTSSSSSTIWNVLEVTFLSRWWCPILSAISQFRMKIVVCWNLITTMIKLKLPFVYRGKPEILSMTITRNAHHFARCIYIIEDKERGQLLVGRPPCEKEVFLKLYTC